MGKSDTQRRYSSFLGPAEPREYSPPKGRVVGNEVVRPGRERRGIA